MLASCFRQREVILNSYDHMTLSLRLDFDCESGQNRMVMWMYSYYYTASFSYNTYNTLGCTTGYNE